jgi:uncharacterized OB-fold protein
MTSVSDTGARAFGPDSRDWHAALERGELHLPRCGQCGRCHFPPMPACPNCGAPGRGEPVVATGLGRVYSWVVARMALDPAFAGEIPYAIVAVDLDEGPRVFGRYLGDEQELADGLRVRFRPRTADGVATLAFEPVAG